MYDQLVGAVIINSINIYFDGSCNPPNGNGNTRGGIVFEQDQEVIYQGSKSFGRGTNNYAEFSSLLFALRTAKKHGYTKANCYGDSSLVINAMNGECVIRKPSLLSIYVKIEEIILEFDWVSFMYIKRNTGLHVLADQLSKV